MIFDDYEDEHDQVVLEGNEELAPDMTDCVIGVRSWELDRSIFRLNAGFGKWNPGENVAVCKVKGNHKAPEKGCDCGLYVYHDIARFDTNRIYGPIWGGVAAWGDILVKGDGFKAERAEIVCLCFGPDIVPDEQMQKDMDLLCDIYGVDQVEFTQLEDKILEYGSPIPKSLYPVMTKKKVSKLVQRVPVALASRSVAPPTVLEYTGGRTYVPAPLYKARSSVTLAIITWWCTFFAIVGLISGGPVGLMLSIILSPFVLVGFWILRKR